MKGLKKINKEMTLQELLSAFEAHRNEGWSATSFHGRFGVGQAIVRQWLKRFPSFEKAYLEAREQDRLVSFYGVKTGPESKASNRGGL